tara:strand:- start:934 stop:1674 length:741 start_codon:yes stop_codon:yes gene_type:complete
MSVSIIMPYYKKREFVGIAIESALSQTYQDFEIIIIYDDENLDDFEYIKAFENNDLRIKVIKNKSKVGAGISRNIGIKDSSKKFIAFLDCDDVWKKNKLEEQIKFMNQNQIDFSFTAYDIIDYSNKKIGERQTKKILSFNDLVKSCDIGLSTVVLKRELINDDCKFAPLSTKEDYVLWLNIAKKNVKLYGINDNLAKWRKLDNSLSSSTFQKLIDGYKVYNKYMNYNKIISIIYLLRLSLNYLIKK